MNRNVLTGVILAGGQNRRMDGRVKALLPFHGEPVIVRQIGRMKRICDQIIVVTRDRDLFSQTVGDSARLIEDRIPGKGPLSGMHAAFSELNSQEAWVVGCDMPFISDRAALLMWEQKQDTGCDVVVPKIGGRIHPLHGIYDGRCISHVTGLLRSGQYRVKELFNRVKWMAVEEGRFLQRKIDIRFVVNVNTPEEYEEALSLKVHS